MILINYMKGLIGDFNASAAVFEHSVTKGSAREHFIKEFLEKHFLDPRVEHEEDTQREDCSALFQSLP